MPRITGEPPQQRARTRSIVTDSGILVGGILLIGGLQIRLGVIPTYPGSIYSSFGYLATGIGLAMVFLSLVWKTEKRSLLWLRIVVTILCGAILGLLLLITLFILAVSILMP